MQTTITARHCEISDALRERALTVVERLGNLASRPIEATVVFDVEGDGRPPSCGCTSPAGRCSSPAERRRITAPRSTAPKTSCAVRWRRRRPIRAAPDLRRPNPSDAPPPGLPLPPRRSTPARGPDRRTGAGPAAARRRGGRTGSGPGRLHRPLRTQPASRLRRDRDHLPELAPRGGSAQGTGEVLRVRATLHLRHQGPGRAAGNARAREVPRVCR